MMIRKENGFTLIELLIVIAVIGILAAFALPAFQNRINQAAASTCKSNLHLIETSTDQWLADNLTEKRTDATIGGLVPGYIKRTPVCPRGGAYDATVDPPTCGYGETDAGYPHVIGTEGASGSGSATP